MVTGHSLGGACANVVSYFRSVKGITFESISSPTNLVTNFRSKHSVVSSLVFGNHGKNTISINLPGVNQNDLKAQHEMINMTNAFKGSNCYDKLGATTGSISTSIQTITNCIAELSSIYSVVLGLSGKKGDEGRLRAIATILTPAPLSPIVQGVITMGAIILDSKMFRHKSDGVLMGRSVKIDEKYFPKIGKSDRRVIYTDVQTGEEAVAHSRHFEEARKQAQANFVALAMHRRWTSVFCLVNGRNVIVSGSQSWFLCPCDLHHEGDKINALTLATLQAANVLKTPSSSNVRWYGVHYDVTKGKLWATNHQGHFRIRYSIGDKVSPDETMLRIAEIWSRELGKEKGLVNHLLKNYHDFVNAPLEEEVSEEEMREWVKERYGNL